MDPRPKSLAVPPGPPGLAVFRSMIEESEMKTFPDNDLLRHLRLVTQDAEKCSSVAQQLLNGKRQTRYAARDMRNAPHAINT